ncbi:radical sam domain-containing protein : UPF0313 protein Psta_1639 OS=Pirellula staleyi (strain ATCC 27377 / DSM 6068 / ICPB 4128) GN=Psta_1639 PE=3 SV=1 [Tuwongella immobilis]|uniref:Radical sam domain-containing protein: UPF0313 protein Psta_1639 n=1 Tax=Tuwongella immobilis TaxID=692036 RepID=A0A6C2YU29_9BACT|nr:radical sam domain-containing protein : UPF0313 protein Psta_1639 OS=Pirellula staleyi (strain ATCC 27377 / DSM 6068 / ICPB 4128) GN=Psta_1639 PE=3 SV=1 [Tuwongella immobilis]VTS06192.1 radical sam domain-containing protein : UPF0313 protein Psta_1639 OS=Pirellula staleyi (strain ATCC 27377 / DSM 6068 / ICPB 4128) GN=Psta_1639 PE=3 SV=1 [Tuwongella immobilis]
MEGEEPRVIPFDIASGMWYTGVDPMSMKPVTIAKNLRDRMLQRALIPFFRPGTGFATAKHASLPANTTASGMVGDSRMLANPPKDALENRRRDSNQAIEQPNDHNDDDSIANPANRGIVSDRGATPLQNGSRRDVVADPSATNQRS